MGYCSSWHLIGFCWVFIIFHVDRRKKPHCTVLLGTATTLLRKHCVKQVATWTLKTKKGRLRSWQHLLGVTMILWSAWQNTGLTFMQQTRLVWVAFGQELRSENTGVAEPELWIPSFECCKLALFPWHEFFEQFTGRLFRTAAVFKLAHWWFFCVWVFANSLSPCQLSPCEYPCAKCRSVGFCNR